MSKFLKLTYMGHTRMVNVDKIYTIDEIRGGVTNIYLTGPDNPQPWVVRKDFKQVLAALEKCATIVEVE